MKRASVTAEWSPPNGCGKTTLVKTLRGEIPALGGEMRIPRGVRRGYYDQEHGQLDLRQTPLESCLDVEVDETKVRTMLACLKLRTDLLREPLGMLSPGERSKTALVRLLLGGHNLLILDEPTNHLEIEAQEPLADALRQFPGAVLFASHDRWFRDAVATSHLDLRAPVAVLKSGKAS